MEQIVDLEQRISAALERLRLGLERLDRDEPGRHRENEGDDGAKAAADAELSTRLADELAASAQLVAGLQQQHQADRADQRALSGEIDRLTRLLDQQGLELNRMRHHVIQLREHLRQTREAAASGVVEASLINRALITEVDALAASRSAELAELDELLAELAPFVQIAEQSADADAAVHMSPSAAVPALGGEDQDHGDRIADDHTADDYAADDYAGDDDTVDDYTADDYAAEDLDIDGEDDGDGVLRPRPLDASLSLLQKGPLDA